MEIEISNELLENIEKVSKEMGISKNEVVARAVLLYLKNAKKFEELQEEINGWEDISVRDNADFFEKHNL